MKKILSTLLVFASCSLFAIDSVVIRTTQKDNKIVEKTVKTTPVSEGVSKIVIKAKDIGKDCQYFDVLADNATAQKGEPGFWLCNRGLLGYFNKDNGGYTNPKQYIYLPYFAMKNPRETFIAIVDGMRFEFTVIIEVKDGKYVIFPRWFISDMGFDPYEDITITFYSLPADADYNEMAKAYRRHKLERNPDIKPLKERFATQPYLEQMAKSIPVRIDFGGKPFNPKRDAVDFYPRGGKPFKDAKYGINAEREEYQVRFTPFSEGIKIMKMLKDYGIDDVAICVSGWQTGGHDARGPTTFPVSPESGGEAELKKMIKFGQDLGFIVDGHSNYTDAFTCSPDWSPDNISKSPEGKLEKNGAWSGGRAYNLCLKTAWEKYIKRDIPKIADLGFRGAHYIDVFTAVYPYRCYDPNHPGNRKQIGEIQKQIALKCRELFGGFSSECGFDHFIGQVDYINYVTAPMRAKYIYKSKSMQFIDKFVPFWELVYHDIVLHNTDKITQEVLSQENNLRLIEFGGRPIFYSVGTYNIEGIRQAYKQFLELRYLLLEEMLSHKEIADNVFEIKYGDGSVVVVNRTNKAFDYNGQKILAMSYKLFKPSLVQKVKNWISQE